MKKKLNYKLLLLIAVLIGVGLAISGCVSGITAIGWSGGAVSDNTVYVGSREGRLVAWNTVDNSRQWSEQIKLSTQPGLFGCNLGFGGCGTTSSNSPVYGTPVISNGLVYVAGYNGKIYAINTTSNTTSLATRWVYPRDSYLPPIVGGIVIDQGKLFFGISEGTIEGKKVKGRVYALNATTGDFIWSIDTGDKVWATPAVSGGTLYVGSFDKKLYALDTVTGKEKWDKPFETQGAIMATPLVNSETIYIGSLDKNLYAVNALTGQGKVLVTAENWFWGEPVIVNGTVYAGCLDGNVYVVRADNGAKVATLNLNSPVASNPVVIDNAVIFATRKGVIYSIDTATNTLKQLANINLEIDGPLTASGDIIYLQTQDINLQRINATTGAVLPPVSLKSGS